MKRTMVYSTETSVIGLLENSLAGVSLLFCVLAASLFYCAGAFASVDDHTVCSENGIAGIAFGQRIDEQGNTLDEQVDSGVTYYRYDLDEDASLFDKAIVGLTPVSRQVFSIRFEKHGTQNILQTVVRDLKQLYIIGDSYQGGSAYRLSYECDHLIYREAVFKELQ